jgi:hypothetical protein
MKNLIFKFQSIQILIKELYSVQLVVRYITP